MREKSNFISSLKVGDDWLLGDDEVADYIISYYQELYMESFQERPFLDGIEFDTILGERHCWLERPSIIYLFFIGYSHVDLTPPQSET